jgi:hypothetical protein
MKRYIAGTQAVVVRVVEQPITRDDVQRAIVAMESGGMSKGYATHADNITIWLSRDACFSDEEIREGRGVQVQQVVAAKLELRHASGATR